MIQQFGRYPSIFLLITFSHILNIHDLICFLFSILTVILFKNDLSHSSNLYFERFAYIKKWFSNLDLILHFLFLNLLSKHLLVGICCWLQPSALWSHVFHRKRLRHCRPTCDLVETLDEMLRSIHLV